MAESSLYSVGLCSSVCFYLLFHYLARFLNLTLLKNYHRATIAEVSNKVVSSIHAMIIVCASIVVAIDTRHDLVKAYHPLTIIYLWVSVGYNFYDLYAMNYVFNEKNSTSMINLSMVEKLKMFLSSRPAIVVHHLVFILIIVILEPTRTVRGDFVIACMNFMEFSTPFVSLRSILSEIEMKQTTLYMINGILMIVSFFICRVLNFPFMFYCYSVYENISFWHVFVAIPRKCVFICSIAWSLQLYWFYLMTVGGLKFLKKSETLKNND